MTSGPINRSVSAVSTFSTNSNPDVIVQEDGDEVANEKFPWSYGLFSCLAEPVVALKSCFGFCYYGGQLHARVQKKNMSWDMCCCLCALPFAYSYVVRNEVIEQYGIDEGGCASVSKAVFCPCCSIGQGIMEATENQDM